MRAIHLGQDQQVAAEPVHERPAARRADAVGQPRTDEVAERPHDGDQNEIELVTGGCEPGAREGAAEEHRDLDGIGMHADSSTIRTKMAT